MQIFAGCSAFCLFQLEDTAPQEQKSCKKTEEAIDFSNEVSWFEKKCVSLVVLKGFLL